LPGSALVRHKGRMLLRCCDSKRVLHSLDDQRFVTLDGLGAWGQYVVAT